MAGMVVSASTGVMNSLLSKLSVLLSDQYKQLKGVRRDIESLSRELTDMNAALVMLAEREELDLQTKVWRDKVREMAYDIEDVIDIFMHHHGQKEDGNDGLFQKAARKIRKLRVRYQIAGMIRDIKARVQESASKPTVVKVDPRLPAMFEDANRLVGIVGPREKIIELLMEEGAADSGQLKVVSIVGFGGLGKTTLANQVYTKIKNEFECTAFISVSRTPHMPTILKDILSKVGYGGSAKMEDDTQKLIEILRAQLMNKRYLVVIDDLWSLTEWRTINCAFVGNNKSSRVITTTRIEDVATACCFPSQVHVYRMKPLDENHSRRLFFKRLFNTEDGCPKELKGISDAMLRKCKGVPLAITSIASLLANQSMRVESWEKVRNSLGSELDTNPTLEWMKHVLSLSYNDLSRELKTCLLFLGTYPEDHRIWKGDLLRKWIAEGFVREKHGLDLEEAAENCLNELINRSMVQPLLHHSLLLGCHVHDLMLDLIISKCKDENFITIIDGKLTNIGASQGRRISQQLNDREMAIAIVETSPSKIRSYYSFPTAEYVASLSKFELLRILDLQAGFNTQYPCLDLSDINHLFLLRYLKVQGFDLVLPKKFAKLKYLMTLDMSRARLDSGNQSSDFTSLSSLRHLALPHTLRGGEVVLTNGLSKLCNLRSLSNFVIGANSAECIRDLGELTKLRALELSYYWPGDVDDNRDTILAATLDKLGNSNLRSLSLSYFSPSTQFWTNFLTRPRHLQRLRLYGLLLPIKVPTWMEHAERLSHLRKLGVQELWSDDFQVLARLPCLIFLCLEAKTIPERNIVIYANTFSSLKYFEFSYEPSCILTFEPDAMPRLQKLEIRLDGLKQGSMQLQDGSPVSGIEHLASLEEISLNIYAGCGHASKVESAWRDAISRHPKSQATQIHVHYRE